MRRAARLLRGVVSRDARIAFGYPLPFFTRWLALTVSIAATFYVSHLIGGTRMVPDARTYFTYVCVNLTFLKLASTVLQAVPQAVRMDQLYGTLEPIAACGVTLTSVSAFACVWPLIYALVEAAFALWIACRYFGLRFDGVNMISLGMFLTLGLSGMFVIGLLSASLVIAFKQIPPAGHLVGGAAAFFAGVLFPIALLPKPLQAVSWMLPLTHALNGLRGAVAGFDLGTLRNDAIWLLVLTIAGLPVALACMRFAVRRALLEGSLSHY